MNNEQAPKIYTFVVLKDITQPSPYTGRIYPRDELLKAIQHFEAANPLPVGELDHPLSGSLTVDFSRVSHKIVKTYLTGNMWMVDITVMKTTMGIILQQLIDQPTSIIRLSPRGVGVVDANHKITNYKLVTFDVLTAHDQQVQA